MRYSLVSYSVSYAGYTWTATSLLALDSTLEFVSISLLYCTRPNHLPLHSNLLVDSSPISPSDHHQQNWHYWHQRSRNPTSNSVAGIVTAINISVYCIFIPARLHVSPQYERVDNIWDRCEKVIYLIVDGLLNWKFIRTVQTNLLKMGLQKYRSLMQVNIGIVLLSLSMDVRLFHHPTLWS